MKEWEKLITVSWSDSPLLVGYGRMEREKRGYQVCTQARTGGLPVFCVSTLLHTTYVKRGREKRDMVIGVLAGDRTDVYLLVAARPLKLGLTFCC